VRTVCSLGCGYWSGWNHQCDWKVWSKDSEWSFLAVRWWITQVV